LAHAHGNTRTTDLWDALEAATGQPVRRIADSWIFQGGFPLLTVDLHDGRTLRVEQEHFGYEGDLGEGDGLQELLQDAQRWSVPVLATVSGGGVTTVQKLLAEGQSTDVDLIEPVEWLLVNTAGTGFYRVTYAP